MSDSALLHHGRGPRWSFVVPVLVIAVLLVPLTLGAMRERARRQATALAVEEHCDRAKAALATGDFRRAEVALDAARALAPQDPVVQRRIWQAALQRAAVLPHTVRDEELDALEYALAVEASDGPLDAIQQVVQAQIALRRGEADRAKTLLETALAAEPGNRSALLALGNLHRSAGRKVEALEAFEAAVKVAPEDLTALNNLGVHYLDLGRNEEGIEMFRKAIAVRDNAASRLNIGEALAGVKRLEEAIEHLKRAAELAPRSPEVYRRLGGLFQLGGKYAEAEQMLLRSFDLSKDAVTAANLGVLYQSMGRHDRAAEVLRQVLAAQPDAVEVAYRLGISLRALGERQAAIAAFQHYLRGAGRIPEEAQRTAEVQQLLAELAGAPAPADLGQEQVPGLGPGPAEGAEAGQEAAREEPAGKGPGKGRRAGR